MPTYTLNINNKIVALEADSDMPLLWLIRDLAKLKGTKYGCGMGLCGACTVWVDGIPARSCLMQVGLIKPTQKIITIEGLGDSKIFAAVQSAWIENQVPQCGYCQSGQIMSAVALLESNSSPTAEQISTHMNGNLCRCGTYDRIRKSIEKVGKFKVATYENQ